jgi:hypothetical protein
MTDWSRWQGWRGSVTYWKGWAAYQIWSLFPLSSPDLPFWSYGWLLPSVGDYVYWDDAIALMEYEQGGSDDREG